MKERSSRIGRAGFTLVELLVVIGIIALIAALLLPAIASARASARTLACGSNVRQVCQALYLYAAANKGWFPPNTPAAPARWWSDADRVGQILIRRGAEAKGLVVTCPEDPDSTRSYAMNVWASSAMDPKLASSGTGETWKSGARGSSQLILVTERWSGSGNAAFGWYAPPQIGDTSDTPGRRFGGGGGLLTPSNAGRWGTALTTQIAYNRHRARKGPGQRTDAVGRIQIGYADGHVALKSNDDLVFAGTAQSTLDSLWSPMDPKL